MDLEAKYKPPFNILVEPFQEELTKINRMARQSADSTVKQIQAAKNRILNTFRYGLAACDEHTHIESCPTPNFFTLESCNKAFLVEMRRVELLSENISTALSPSASDVLRFAPLHIHQQIYSFAIPLFLCGAGKFRRVFPYDLMPDLRPAGKPKAAADC